jgi:hypothetical protein
MDPVDRQAATLAEDEGHNLRGEILRWLDEQLADHDDGCIQGICVHAGAAALLAVVDLHAPSTRRGSEDTCDGCAVPGVAFVWLDRCKTLAAIAAAVGMTHLGRQR